VDLGDVGARREAHGVAGRGHGVLVVVVVVRRRYRRKLHLRGVAASVALLLLLLGSILLRVNSIGHFDARRRRA